MNTRANPNPSEISATHPSTGRLFGVGTGPGDPELLTLKAARVLRESPVVAYFCKRGGAGRARTSCLEHITDEHIEEPLVYPVTTELPHDSAEYRERIEAFFDESGRRLAEHLDAGRDVTVLNEGDAFFYGSFMHVFMRLRETYEATVIPGVDSIMACGALLPRPLAMRDDVLTVVPGTMDDEALARSVQSGKAVAIMKVGYNLPRIRGVAERLGLADQAWYVEQASMPGERMMPLSETGNQKAPYFSMILIPGPGERQ